jgi:hypothetical protein
MILSFSLRRYLRRPWIVLEAEKNGAVLAQGSWVLVATSEPNLIDGPTNWFLFRLNRIE